MFEGLQSVPNVHPLVVHFPIGLLITGGALFVAARFIDNQEIAITAKWCLILGSLASIVAVGAGFMAEKTVPHSGVTHPIMEKHESIMVPMCLLSIALSGFLLYRRDLSAVKNNVVFLVAVVVMMGMIAVGADYGAQLVFKYGIATELYKKVHSQDEEVKHEHESGVDHPAPVSKKEDATQSPETSRQDNEPVAQTANPPVKKAISHAHADGADHDHNDK